MVKETYMEAKEVHLALRSTQTQRGAWFVALHLTVWSVTVNESSLLRASRCLSTCPVLTHQNFTTPLKGF